jgi:GT2 family glycosyltransferase
MKLVSIVTVNFNHSHVTEALLQSIDSKNTYLPLEIIVVDNGSKENPIPGWKLKYPHVQFIRSETNLGFAGGNNLGLNIAKGDYLFLINNDTEITASLLPIMVGYMDANPQVGIVSPKIHYYDHPGMLQYAGYTPMNYITARNSCIGQFEEDKGQYDHLTGPTGYAHGAAMMVRKEAIEKAGLMAENYFLYYEELDWCERIRKKGYEVHRVMQALIYHKESVSVGQQSALKEYFMNRNRILFMRKNTTLLRCLVFYCYFMAVVVPRNILQYIRKKQNGFITVLFRAIGWNMTHATNSSDLGFKVKQ